MYRVEKHSLNFKMVLSLRECFTLSAWVIFSMKYSVRKLSFAPCKRIRNPESSKLLLLESGIQTLESGIHNGLESRIHFGMESGIQKVGIQNPKS